MTIGWDKARDDIDEISPEYYSRSIIDINNFFDVKVLPDLKDSKWDLCVNVIRNGESIFNEQMRRNMRLDKIELINDHDINKFQNKIKSKKILLFDDSIKKGETIDRILRRIIPYKPTCISIATILCPENLLSQLKPKFPQVNEIISAYEVEYDGNRFSEIKYKHYLKIIEAYSKYTCLPNQDGQTHPYILIKIKQNKGREILKDLDQYADRIISNISSNFSFIGRDNVSICLKKSILENIKSEFGCDIDCLGETFVRIFLREDAQKIIIQPIIRNYENFDSNEEDDIKKADLKTKCAILNFVKNKINREHIINCKICKEREFIHEA